MDKPTRTTISPQTPSENFWHHCELAVPEFHNQRMVVRWISVHQWTYTRVFGKSGGLKALSVLVAKLKLVQNGVVLATLKLLDSLHVRIRNSLRFSTGIDPRIWISAEFSEAIPGTRGNSERPYPPPAGFDVRISAIFAGFGYPGLDTRDIRDIRGF
ncbi:hypothetical protein SISNIDRAFT_471740 [Sistotremastrum niveocremeum HHB9708]|uniref:Uncharacterized protein n=1 Tax=Sistotremastrum niveocremeum HHB9708 TaxID=1314777 RepID=A0A164MA31_9AGAM|nr:hypothetical protein SISNIDRAFT_471740 [Sistotremastrum niveocremeum HHB9708]